MQEEEKEEEEEEVKTSKKKGEREINESWWVASISNKRMTQEDLIDISVRVCDCWDKILSPSVLAVMGQ